MNNEQIVSSRTQSERLLFADDTVIIAFTRKQSLNILESNFRTDGQLLWFKDNGVDKIIAGRHEDGFIHICCPYNLSMDLYDVNRANIVLIMEAWNRLNRDFQVTRDGSRFYVNNANIWDGNDWYNTRINVSSRTQNEVLSIGEMSVVDAFINRGSWEDGDGWNYRLKTDGNWLWLNGNPIAAHSDAEGLLPLPQNPSYIWLNSNYTPQNCTTANVNEMHHTVLIWNNLNPNLRVRIDGLYFVVNGRAWSGETWNSSRIRSKPSTVNVSSRTQEVVTAFLNKRSKSQYAPLNTDGHKMRYEGSTIAKHDNGKVYIRMGLDNHEEKIKVLLMIPGVDSIVWENSFGYRVNGRRWSDEWFEVGLYSRLATNTTDFDVTSIWMEKLKYNKPKFAVVDTTQKQSLDFIMFVLSENDIEFKSMVSDTYGKYEPHYFLIVKPQFFDEAKQLLINKQQEL